MQPEFRATLSVEFDQSMCRHRMNEVKKQKYCLSTNENVMRVRK